MSMGIASSCSLTPSLCPTTPWEQPLSRCPSQPGRAEIPSRDHEHMMALAALVGPLATVPSHWAGRSQPVPPAPRARCRRLWSHLQRVPACHPPFLNLGAPAPHTPTAAGITRPGVTLPRVDPRVEPGLSPGTRGDPGWLFPMTPEWEYPLRALAGGRGRNPDAGNEGFTHLRLGRCLYCGAGSRRDPLGMLGSRGGELGAARGLSGFWEPTSCRGSRGIRRSPRRKCCRPRSGRPPGPRTPGNPPPHRRSHPGPA